MVIFLNVHLQMNHTLTDNFIEVLKSKGSVGKWTVLKANTII